MNTINSFIIKGERCSGTNYLEKLIETNLNIKHHKSLEWKHGFFSLSATENFSNSCIDYLAIVIFRNVLDWARSFYLSPHHLKGTFSASWIEKPSFSEFIRRKVELIDTNNQERHIDRHPYLLDVPKNIFELRKWKIENWLNYQKLSKPVYYLQYEKLLQDPEKVIKDINDKWFKINYSFQNWIYYQKDTNKIYKSKKYFIISDNDMAYIINNVDWNLEKKIGYNIEKLIINQ